MLLHIFSLLLTCTTTIISLESCALNAEYRHFILELHHFKVGFIKIVFTFQTPLKEGIGGERRPKDRVKRGFTFRDNSIAMKDILGSSDFTQADI